MLVLDSDARMEWQKAAVREKSAAQRQKDLEHDLVSNTISVGDDAGRDTSNLLAQLGRPMTAQDLIDKLKLCNPFLIFVKHPTYPLYGIYIEKWVKNTTGGFEKKRIHICGMESAIMPEFSVLHKAKKKVADPELFAKRNYKRELSWKEIETFAHETRGWRTVLIRLLHHKLITKRQVDYTFNWTPSQESEKWHQLTKETIHVASH